MTSERFISVTHFVELLRSCQLVARSSLVTFFTEEQPSLKFHLSYRFCSCACV